MGDHRADIKIKFSMYGKTRDADMWINYSPDGEWYGIDQRVVDFFRDSYQAMRSEYDAEIIEIDLEREDAEKENAERAEYERLRAKFESTGEQQ
jgi:hypothetical protein